MTMIQSCYGYLCAIVLWTVHFTLDIISLSSKGKKRIYVTVTRLLQGRNPRLSTIRPYITSATKKPEHLLLGFNEDVQDDIFDVCKLVLWAASYGTQHISVWDKKGSLAKNFKHFQDTLSHQHEEFFGNSEASLYPYSITCGFCHKEGHKEMSRIYVLSPQDGKSNIVEMVSTLRTHQTLTVREFDVMLNHKGKCPEPDVLLSFGEHTLLYGILPWQLRVTEILHLGPHRDLLPSEFANAMQKYSKIERRLGK